MKDIIGVLKAFGTGALTLWALLTTITAVRVIDENRDLKKGEKDTEA